MAASERPTQLGHKGGLIASAIRHENVEDGSIRFRRVKSKTQRCAAAARQQQSSAESCVDVPCA